MTAEAEVFKALGDETRLAIVRQLLEMESAPISSLAEHLPITRQGVRKHLEVLEQAGVIALMPKGREVHVSLKPEPLQMARLCLEQIERRWDDRLAALKRFVELGEVNEPSNG